MPTHADASYANETTKRLTNNTLQQALDPATGFASAKPSSASSAVEFSLEAEAVITFEEARSTAAKHLSEICGDDKPVKLISEVTQAHDFGWVFFYQSGKYIDSRYDGDLLSGNAPFIVTREDGRILVTGTSRPLEYYLQRFLETGHPQAVDTSRVQICDWHRGADKVQLTKAIRRHGGVGLRRAKEYTDAVLAGDRPVVNCTSIDDAIALARVADEYGFDVQRLYEIPAA